MAKPTPGPWDIDPERPTWANGNEVGFYVYSPESQGRIGQTFENCLVTTTDEARANARLIAAAPDLLEALKTLAAEEWRDDDDVILLAARRKACAAIAKAEGK